MKMECVDSQVVEFMNPNFFFLIIRCGVKIECTNSQISGFMSPGPF